VLGSDGFMIKDKCLLDLPVIPFDRDRAAATNEIVESYLNELNQVQTEDALHAFIQKWRSVWLLKSHLPDADNELMEDEVFLLEGKFDLAKVLRHLAQRKEDSHDFEDPNVRVMAHLAVPRALLQASIGSSKFDVGMDLILVRLFLDPYKEYEDCCREGSGDLRESFITDVMDK